MRLNNPVLMLGTVLTATVNADRWHIEMNCLFSCVAYGKWHYNDNRQFDFDGTDGCRVPYIPGIKEFCMDYGRARAHFYEDGGTRRCMARGWYENPDCGDFIYCINSWWDEIPCTWPPKRSSMTGS